MSCYSPVLFVRFAFLLCLSCLLSLNSVQATHLWGSYFRVVPLDSTKHLVYLTVIRDCNGVAYTSAVISFQSGNSQFTDTLSSQHIISNRDITGLSPDCQVASRCSGGNYMYGFQELVFVDTIDLSGYSACEWLAIHDESTRSQGINMWPPLTDYYNYLIFNKCLVNSTPKFKSTPTSLLSYNQDVKLSFAVSDAQNEEDSFSYELDVPLEAWNQQVNSSYTIYHQPRYLGHPNPASAKPSGFHLNALTGLLEFRPTQMNQLGIIVVGVKEWRKINDTMRVISFTRMDKQYITLSSAYAGHASGINNLPSIQTAYEEYHLCIGDTFRLAVSTSDPDNDSTYLSWDEAIQTATFSTNNGNDSFASGEFAWAPSLTQTRANPYFVTFTVRDATCPMPATSSKTITFYVHDSLFAPSVDLGNTIIDSIRKDVFLLTPTITNLNGRSVLWTTTGDGTFADPHSPNTSYTQGLGDKTNCAYQLKLEVLNPQYCYGNGGVWMDSIQVLKRYDSLFIQTNSSYFYGDTQTLSLKKAASIGQDFWWETSGDGWFDDSTSANPKYIPGSKDWSECGWSIYLNYEKQVCAMQRDSMLVIRKLALWHGPNDTAVLRGDTIYLTAVLYDSVVNSQVIWSTLGSGIFGDTLALSTWYIPSAQDLTLCSLDFQVEEWPKMNRFSWQETTTVSFASPAQFEAGSNLQLYFGDTAQLNATPQASSNYQFGYWTTAGDGYFADSTDAQSAYILGTNDWINCGTTLYWNERDQNCSGQIDSIKLLRVSTLVQAGNDQNQFYDPSLTYSMQGVSDTANGQFAYWTSNGDGTFNDSFDLNAVYTPGTNDLQNCRVTLKLTGYPAGSCSVFDEMDIQIQDSAVKILQASVDSNTFDTVFVSIYSVANRANLSWSTNGTGSFILQSATGVAYVLSASDTNLTNLELIVTNDAPCLTSRDTVRVNPTLRKIQAPNGFEEQQTTYSLFPNPTNRTLNLRIDGSAEKLNIYDIQGKEIRLIPNLENNTYTWDVSSLVRGTYVLVVIDEQGVKQAIKFSIH